MDIAAPLENLARKLFDMRKQENQEMERRKSETEEEKERRLQEEEVIRKREVERRKMCVQKELQRRMEEAAAPKPPVSPPVWDAVLGKNGGTQPAVVSMFNLSMNNGKQVLCKSIKEESLQELLRRVENDDYVVPISKTPTSSGSREVLGFVEAYSALGTCSFGPRRGSFMDKSGRMLSYVSMYRTVRGKCSQ